MSTTTKVRSAARKTRPAVEVTPSELPEVVINVGDWVKIARHSVGDESMKGEYEVAEVSGSIVTIYKNSAAYDAAAIAEGRFLRRPTWPLNLSAVERVRCREWQEGDLVEGENPAGETVSGAVRYIGNKWLRLAGTENQGVLAATARLITPATGCQLATQNPQDLAENSDPLAAIAAEISQLGREGDEALATALAAGNAAFHLRLAMGERLEQAKKLVKAAGQKWLPWLETNCPNVSERTCQLAMRLHKNREQLQAQADFDELTLTEADALLRKPKELTAAAEEEKAELEKTAAPVVVLVDALALETYAKLISAESLSRNKIQGFVDLFGRKWVITGGSGVGPGWKEMHGVQAVPLAQWSDQTYSYEEMARANMRSYRGQLATYRKEQWVLTANKISFELKAAATSQVDASATYTDTAEEDDVEPAVYDAAGELLSVGDVVLNLDGELFGQIKAIQPEDFLPVTLQTYGGETKVKATSVLLAPEEVVASLTEQAQRRAAGETDDQSSVEEAAPVTGDSERRYKVGDLVVDKFRPYSTLVVAQVSDTQACCWAHTEEFWIGWSQLEPYQGPEEVMSLESVVQFRLKKLVKVLGKDAIAAMLEEV